VPAAFDHILFTGSTRGRQKVIAAASAEPVPVTLELRRQSPAIVHSECDCCRGVERSCAASCSMPADLHRPDYALVPRAKLEAFLGLFRGQRDPFLPRILA
jgi:coniferyl-aldehyde dehydrogenase